METKISNSATCHIKEKQINDTSVYFYDNFGEQGDQSATLILTDKDNIDTDNNIGIYIHLSTDDLIRLKNAINSHLEQISEYRSFIQSEKK